MHISDKELVSRRCKELLQLNNKIPPQKKKIQCKNWAKDLSRHIKENTVMDNEKRKRYSLPLVTREMENKTVVRCHCTSTGRSEIKKIGNAMSPNM